MSFNSGTEEYYQKFIELQEKLRKSEEERLKLEIKFNEMLQVTREEEQMHYRKLRSQYKRYLEEDRRRQDRNERILRSLERIDSRVAMLVAKTERFKLLRQQYHTFLERVYKMNQLKKTELNVPQKETFQPPAEDKSDLVQSYLQNLSSQKLRDKLAKEELFNFGDNELRRNQASSIADDIMSSIYSKHKANEDSKRENNNNFDFGRQKSRDFHPEASESDDLSGSSVLSVSTGLGKRDDKQLPRGEQKGGKMETKVVRELEHARQAFGNDNVSFGTIKNEDVKMYHPPRQDFVNENLPFNTVKNDDLKISQPPRQTFVNDNFRVEAIKNDDEKTYEPPLQTFVNKNAHFQPPKGAEEDQFVQKGEPIDSAQFSYYQNEKTKYESPKEESEPKFELPEKQEVELTENVLDQHQIEEVDKNTEFTHNLSDLPNEQPIEEKQPSSSYQDQVLETNQSEQESPQDYYDKSQKVLSHDHNEQLDENGQPIQYDESQQFIQQGQFRQQYDETGQHIQQFDETGQHIQQFDETGQPIQQFDETGQPIQQYNESKQPVQQYDETGQLIQQFDETGQPIQQYNESKQPVQQYDETGQSIQQYDETGQPIQQYDETGQPIQHYDETGQPIQQYNETGQPIQQYDETGQPIQQYNESRQPVQQYDETGQPIQQYDETGQAIQQYDETGQPIQQYNECRQQYDETGQPIQQYDETGQLIQQYDETGQPVQQYDETGQPIIYDESQSFQHYDQDGQPYVQYDEQYQGDGQIYQQYDEHGQLQQYDSSGQLLQQYDENGQLSQQQYQYDDGQVIQQYDVSDGQQFCEEPPSDQQFQPYEAKLEEAKTEETAEAPASECEISQEREDLVVAAKTGNVMDMLDTDTESVKQQNTKISNDSDFDFSNG